jgi:4-amino-4-deoxy-L-arabinose transferase-like glycosyltransferase
MTASARQRDEGPLIERRHEGHLFFMMSGAPRMLAYSQAGFGALRRWLNAWYDNPHAVPILLCLFVVAWATIQVISFSSIGLHEDVLEMFAWGRHIEPSYDKHPPLGAMMSKTWFAIFPAADWSAHLMSIANAGVSLYFVDMIARRYVSADKRVLVLLLLLLTPFYQFDSVRFGANQTLLPTWPLAIYCFIRAFETRGIGWSAAAGATAALAMLGKYFSIYLVGGLILAVIVHPERRRYLRSASPWISVATGLAVLFPHIRWLVESGYLPLRYARDAHGLPWLGAAATVPAYLIGALAYVALPVIVFAWAAKPSIADLLASLWPSQPEGRLLAALLWVPLLLPALTAPFLGLGITSYWTMEAWFLLPILLLMPERVRVPREAAVGVAALVVGIAVVVLICSPVLAWIKFRTDRDGRAYYQQIARELAERWRGLTDRPLTIVIGEVSAMATFYLPDHPDAVRGFAFRGSPWVTPERMAHEGFAVLCQEQACATEALRLVAGNADARRVDAEVVTTFLGQSAPPMHVTFVLAPPQAAPQ